jgi:hypothetical protein
MWFNMNYVTYNILQIASDGWIFKRVFSPKEYYEPSYGNSSMLGQK